MQALALKKNFGGIGPVSKIDDNEHTTAPLGQSEVLSVEYPPSCPCPWPFNHTLVWPALDSLREMQGIICPDKRSQETAEGIVVCVEHAGNIFPDGVSKAIRSSKFMSEDRVGESKVRPRVGERPAQTGDRESLARRPAN